MVIGDKGKGKALMKDKKTMNPTMKELAEVKKECQILSDDEPSLDPDTSVDVSSLSDSDSYTDSGDSIVNLKKFISGRDLNWQFPNHTEERQEKPIDIVYPKQKNGSSCRGATSKCQAHYAM
ncbi:hypothetical protein Tco_1567115 [Tanacetum coccineum]